MGCGQSNSEKNMQTPTGAHKQRRTIIDPFQYLNLGLPLEKSYKLLNRSHLDNKSMLMIQLRDLSTAEERTAVKIPIPQNIVKHTELAQKLRVLLALEHPYLQKSFGVFKNGSEYLLVRDDSTRTNLLGFFEKVKMKESRLIKIFESILQGLNQLNQKSIIHGNLSHDSIIFRAIDKSQTPYIVDYGLSDLLNDKLDDKYGQNIYCKPPEALKGDVNDRSDVWSVGVLLYRVVTGKWPFDGQTKDRIRLNIVKGIASFDDVKWNQYSSKCKTLVQDMLRYRSRFRPSAQDCLQNDWFKLKKKKLNDKDKKRLKKSVTVLQIQDKKQQPNKLQQITLMMIADQAASKKKHDKMMNTFRKLDTDNSGALSKEEVYNGLLNVMTEEEAKEQVEQIFQQADIDGQGEIDFYEYMMVFTKAQKLASRKQILKIFNQADIDGSGTLSLAEVRRMLVKLNLSQEEVDAMMIKLDNDGNGNISQEEFVQSIMELFKVQDETQSAPQPKNVSFQDKGKSPCQRSPRQDVKNAGVSKKTKQQNVEIPIPSKMKQPNFDMVQENLSTQRCMENNQIISSKPS